MTSLSVFSFNSNQVRIVTVEGEPWFVAKDVLEAMETSTKVTDLKALIVEDLGDEFVSSKSIPDKQGRNQEVMILSQSALLFLLGRTRTSKGKKMNQWLLKNLPSFNKSTYDFNHCSGSGNDLAGFVYLAMTPNGWCKIGMSKQPYRRMSSLQTGTPLELTLIHRIFTFDMAALEKSLHQYYDAYWMRGEWFDLPAECIEEFPMIANQLDISIENLYLSHK